MLDNGLGMICMVKENISGPMVAATPVAFLEIRSMDTVCTNILIKAYIKASLKMVFSMVLDLL